MWVLKSPAWNSERRLRDVANCNKCEEHTRAEALILRHGSLAHSGAMYSSQKNTVPGKCDNVDVNIVKANKQSPHWTFLLARAPARRRQLHLQARIELHSR
eukprot:1958029-Amphidinium_carterae.1